MTVKFAIQIENQFGYTWPEIKAMVTATEKRGYHAFYTCDHFFLNKDAVNRDAIEAWTMLTAAAMLTDQIKLGTLVTGNNYRNPALLAKIAASLDVISNGRMEFGIGAGWKEVEYHAYGYDFPSVTQRMDMLEETLQIVQSLWSEEKTTFQGNYYTLEDAVFSPKPVQDHPLILIGGGVEKRTLHYVAKYGDYMNLPFTPANQLDRKLAALKSHCEDLGRNYDEVGKSYFTPIFVAETEEEVEHHLQQRAESSNTSLKELKDRLDEPDIPGSWIGTPEMVRDRIEWMQTLGFDYFFIQQPIDRQTQALHNFADLVMDKYFN